MTTEKKSLTQITDDIYQVRLPLPYALNHVNCYLLRGDDGWTIIDTGLNTSQGRAGWQAAFDTLGIGPDDIDQIILTHVHPDHYGMAGWLQEWCGATVWLSPREAELAEQVWVHGDLVNITAEIFAVAGIPRDTAQKAGMAATETQRLTLPHPQTLKLLEPGTVLDIGQRHFKAIHAPGHSDGQLIFYDAEDRLLLSGDQVLIKITPNIGLWSFTEADPLGRYLASLRELATLEVRMALPGHGSVINSWQGRLAELQQHHAERLEKMLAAVNDTGVTPYQVSDHIFNFAGLSMHEVRFAVVETMAHLEYLVDRQRLHREKNGVWLYRQI